ncbi:MAG: tetratricopeptide repeat protein [Firmicutes bacterium]|nr:tetratricopeptide repeat protein [Bacillota bacterium]
MSQDSELQPISGGEQIKTRLKETQILFRQQKYTEAKKILQEILKDDPDNAAAYNNLGSIYLIRGRLARAERYFRKALELDPQLADADENLKAIQKMKKGKGHDEIREEIENLESECKQLIQNKRVEEAIERYKKILELDSTNVKVHNNLGILHFQRNELEEAEKYFVRALELYFHHGMVFDDQYTIIRDNLNKLREKIGCNIADYVKDNLFAQVKGKLDEGELIVDNFLGSFRVYSEGEQVEVSTILTLTNKRLILYYKSSQAHHGEAKWVEYKHADIKNTRMVKGILKNTLIITTPDEEFKFTSQNRNEMKRFLEAVRDAQGGTGAKITSPVDMTSATASPEVYGKIIVSLLDILRDLNVLTDAEVDHKKRALQTVRGPISSIKKRGGLIPSKDK